MSAKKSMPKEYASRRKHRSRETSCAPGGGGHAQPVAVVAVDAVVVGIREVPSALRHGFLVLRIASRREDDRLRVHLQDAAVGLFGIEALHRPVLDNEVERRRVGHDDGAQLLSAFEHGVDVVAAAAFLEPMEAVELAQAMVVVHHAGKLHAMRRHPVDVLSRGVRQVLPQQVVDAVVEELLFGGYDVGEGDAVAHAELLLHLGADGEHALGEPPVSARHVGLL